MHTSVVEDGIFYSMKLFDDISRSRTSMSELKGSVFYCVLLRIAKPINPTRVIGLRQGQSKNRAIFSCVNKENLFKYSKKIDV